MMNDALYEDPDADMNPYLLKYQPHKSELPLLDFPRATVFKDLRPQPKNPSVYSEDEQSDTAQPEPIKQSNTAQPEPIKQSNIAQPEPIKQSDTTQPEPVKQSACPATSDQDRMIIDIDDTDGPLPDAVVVEDMDINLQGVAIEDHPSERYPSPSKSFASFSFSLNVVLITCKKCLRTLTRPNDHVLKLSFLRASSAFSIT
jgi:hypothetical protein